MPVSTHLDDPVSHGILCWDMVHMRWQHLKDKLHPSPTPMIGDTIGKMIQLHTNFSKAMALAPLGAGALNDASVLVRKDDDVSITAENCISFPLHPRSGSEKIFLNQVKVMTAKASAWMRVLFDSGSSFNLIPQDVARSTGLPIRSYEEVIARGVNNTIVKSLGDIELSFSFENGTKMHTYTFRVVTDDQPFQLVLGEAFITATDCFTFNGGVLLPVRVLSTKEQLEMGRRAAEDKVARDAAREKQQKPAAEKRQKERDGKANS